MNFKWHTEKLTNLHGLILIIGAIIASILGGIWWFQDVMFEREQKIIERNAELLSDALIEKIIEKVDPVTSSDFSLAFDSLTSAQERHGDSNIEMHLRTLRRQDTIILTLNSLQRSDAEFSTQIQNINRQLDSIKGITRTSRKENLERALTDSLQNELTRILLEQQTARILKEQEDQHRDALKAIKDAAPPEYPIRTKKTPKGLKIMMHQKKAK